MASRDVFTSEEVIRLLDDDINETFFHGSDDARL